MSRRAARCRASSIAARRSLEYAPDAPAERAEDALDCALSALLQRARMQLAQLRRHRVAVFGILGMRRTALQCTVIRDHAHLLAAHIVGRRECPRRQTTCGA